MRLLFLSWWWPYPPDNGSKIRIYHLLRHLASVHEVYLLSFAEDGEAAAETISHLRTFCAHAEAVPRPRYEPNGLKAVLGFFSRWPRSLVDVYSPAMADRVTALLRSTPMDAVIASQTQTIRYLELAPSIPAIFEECEVAGFQNAIEQAQTPARRFRARLTLSKMEYAVKRLMQRGAAITVASESERRFLQPLAPPGARIVVVPNGVDTAANCPGSETPQPNTLIYPGAVTYDANEDAVRYFVHDVLPLVRQEIPDVRFTVTGGTGSVDVRELAAQPGVCFTGYLPEVAPAIRSSWAVVVPLRKGGGTRLKILEAMALGVPVISTRKGAEGLEVHPGEDILLADTPDEMARAIITLSGDADLRARLSHGGRKLVEENYDWAMIAHRHLDLIEQVANPQQEEIT